MYMFLCINTFQMLSMTTEQAPCADEGHEMQVKAIY